MKQTKTLIVVRHAKSSWDKPLPDFERPLNDRGARDAPVMAKRLKKKNIRPDLVVTSPAIRAVGTCQVFARILNFPHSKVIMDKRLYHASEETMLDVVRALADRDDDPEEVVLLFGHNPGLTEFVNLLSDAGIRNVPTTGVVAIRVNIASWSQLSPGCGELLWFDYPKKEE